MKETIEDSKNDQLDNFTILFIKLFITMKAYIILHNNVKLQWEMQFFSRGWIGWLAGGWMDFYGWMVDYDGLWIMIHYDGFLSLFCIMFLIAEGDWLKKGLGPLVSS